jgi:hypothetical protein
MSKDQKRKREKPYHENTKGGKHERKVEKQNRDPLFVPRENPKNLMTRGHGKRNEPE